MTRMQEQMNEPGDSDIALNDAGEPLDPCCQRELDEKKKYNKVSHQLRQVDPSYKRLDFHQKTVSSLRGYHTCPCCEVSDDYPVLARLRSAYEASDSAELVDPTPQDAESESGSDDEFDLDSFVTPYEMERKREMAEFADKFKSSKQLGFAVHLEESFKHLMEDLKLNIPFVLHVYDRSSELCGNLDLVLEKLAKQFIGTKFRRISNAQSSLLETIERHPGVHFTSSSLSKSNTGSALICLLGGKIACYTDNIHQFGGEIVLNAVDVRKYLDNAHVLFSDIQPLLWHKLTSTSTSQPMNSQEEENDNTYCDDPTCTRFFPHEHIATKRNGAQTANVPSFMKTTNEGEEALAKNIFTRL